MAKPRKRSRAKPKASKMCAGKLAFVTEEEAQNAAYRPKEMLSAWGYMSAYKCKFCKFYHYGHAPTK